MRTSHTVPPFVLQLLIALASMGTDIYQICAWRVGILKVEPWRRSRSALGGIRATALAIWRRLFDGLMSWRGVAVAAAMLALLLAPPSDASAFDAGLAAIAVSGGLKEIRAARAQVHKDYLAAVDEVTKAETPEAKKVAREKAATLQAKFSELGDDEKLSVAAVDQERQLGASIAAGATPKDPSQAAAEGAQRAAGVTVGKDNVEDDPKRGFKDHRDYLKAVMTAGRTGRIDARLKPLAAVGSDEQGEYSDPHGGFLVPHGVAPGILSIAPEDDPVARLATPVEMTAPTVSFNARVDKDHTTSVSGGFVVTRRPETVENNPSRTKFEQVTLVANEEFGLAVATERILTDSPQSFIAIIQAGFRDEYVANGMNERINGTGTGERQGALNAGCKIAVAKETGQKAATVLKENIDKMAARCWRYSRAVWLANHNTRPQLKSLVQVVGTGGNAVPYFVTDGAPAGFDGMLDGRPLAFTEFAKTLGTEGDLMLLVMSEYLEGTYQSEQYAESIHVRFAAAERMFRFYRRNDGQWWWKTALTPKQGDTLAPVITLATRA